MLPQGFRLRLFVDPKLAAMHTYRARAGAVSFGVLGRWCEKKGGGNSLVR